jgi:hypothetical protein
MPGGARLDASGALHHVMVRGIGRTAIVIDDETLRIFWTGQGKVAEKPEAVI